MIRRTRDRTWKSAVVVRVLPVFALVAALALAGCGGGDSGDSGDTAADEAAVETLLLDYAALVDEEACALWSEELLAREGGLQGCLNNIGNEVVTTIRVDDVTIDGDNAEVLLTVFPEKEQFRYPAVRDGDSTDSYDGWRLAEIDVEEVTAEAPETTTDATTADETDTATEVSPADKTDVLQLGTPEERATAYRNCIGVRGAQDIKESQGGLPSVDFSGGGSRVNAVFGSSEEDAEQGLATIQRRKPFFADRFGTVVLYTIGDPLAADLDTGLACVKDIG